MISQRNLSILSNRLAREGGRRIPEGVLERDYCLSWFLVGLSRSSLKSTLLFKGGTAIKKCYIPEYRFSEDLDFTLAEEVSFEYIRECLDSVFEKVREASGIRMHFGSEDRHTHQNSYTFFVGYEGPLPGASAKDARVDITLREMVVFGMEDRLILRGYAEYEDLPENARVCIYSLGEIAAEKVVGLFDRARNEPRDLYDMWYLTQHGYVDVAELVGAVEKKWEFRGGRPVDAKEAFLWKEARFKRLWNVRLSSQMITLPEFSQVYRAVQREFRRAGLLG